MLVEHGKILTIVLSSQVGVSMKPLKNIGSLETLTDQNGAKTVTFTLDAAKTISDSSPNKLHSTLNSFLEVFLSSFKEKLLYGKLGNYLRKYID